MTATIEAREATGQVGTDRLLLVSNDAHVGPPMDAYRAYCPKDMLEEFDQYVAAVQHDRENAATSTIEDESYESVGQRFIKSLTPMMQTENVGYTEYMMSLVSQELAHYDPDTILANMDDDGVTTHTFFHGAMNGHPIPFMGTVGFASGRPYFSGPRGFELCLAGIRMYNQWMADFCSVAPDRLLGLAQIPLWDVDLAVREVEWARNAGIKALNFPAPRPSIPDYSQLSWEPLWAAVEAAGLPLNTHGASSPIVMDMAEYTGEGGWYSMFYELVQFSRRGLHFMIFGGVFERHPGLRLIFTEQPSEWVETTLHDMDGLAKTTWGGFNWKLPKLPSEYFWQNCFVGNSFMSNYEAREAVRQGATNNILWGSDYPHTEGTWPYTRESLRMLAEGISEEDLRKMVGLNAASVYDLDLEKLRAIAARIGPTMEEIRRPLTKDEMPVNAPWTMAFRGKTPWA
jgi:predicted TIM-barrel fold metal-dependent hydrolase